MPFLVENTCSKKLICIIEFQNNSPKDLLSSFCQNPFRYVFATSKLMMEFHRHGNFILINCPSLLKVEGEIKKPTWRGGN